MEEKRPGQYFPVFEDERGLYLFNSRDLALFPFVPDLVNCGVASLKIEGRMKNVHYLAAVLSVYRAILDGKAMPEEVVYKMLGRVSNRGYTFGFMKGRITADDYEINTHEYQSTSTMVVCTTEQMRGEQRICKVKNTIQAGEQVELLTPDGILNYTLPNPLITVEGNSIDHANNQDVIMLGNDLPPYAVLRRVIGAK